MSLAPGGRLGPYEIESPAGAGGMGEVYRARDTRLGRTVAVKILSSPLSATPESRDRFQREARLISSLSHPNICALYDVGYESGTDFVVMEFLEGQTLAQRLKQGPMTVDRALACAIEIAGALDEAHRQNIVHRDLKPGNIMLTRTGAKLLDFGLAKSVAPVSPSAASSTLTSPITAEGVAVGTRPYMSPEQIHGEALDSRTDLFSFGAVLYEMLTGRRAFEGKSEISILSAVLERQPEPIRTFCPALPVELEQLIGSCLVKDAAGRWQSALDLKLRLEAVRDTSGGQVAAGGAKSRWWTGWAAAAVLLIGLLGLLWPRSGPRVAPAPSIRTALLPPSAVSFVPFSFALSPDGRRLAFSGMGADGKLSLWIRPLDSRSAQQISDTEGALYPFWAPDSGRIGFIAGDKLKFADTATGAVQILCDAPFSASTATWSREGIILFSRGADGPLFRVSERGGRPQPTTRIEANSGRVHRLPRFLPDGRRFLYHQDWGASAGPHPNGLYAGSLDPGEPKLISATISGDVGYASGHLLYVQDASLMAQPFDPETLGFTGPAFPLFDQEVQRDHAFGRGNFSASDSGVIVFQSLTDSASEMVWYSPEGQEAGRLAEAGGQTPALSPDGGFVAVSSDESRNGKTYIRVHDLRRGVAVRITNGGAEEFPVWSPDGKRITYAVRGDPWRVLEIQAHGSGEPRLLMQGPRRHPNHYSPDGRFLVYMSFEKGLPMVGVYDRREAKSSLLGMGGEAQYSPDGKWLAQIGLGDLLVSPAAGTHGQVQISGSGGAQPRWSHDGKQIFFLTPARQMMSAAIGSDAGQLRAGPPRLVFQTRVTAPRFADIQYDVTRDGRFLVNSLRPNAPLTLVSGWTKLLER